MKVKSSQSLLKTKLELIWYIIMGYGVAYNVRLDGGIGQRKPGERCLVVECDFGSPTDGYASVRWPNTNGRVDKQFKVTATQWKADDWDKTP